MRTFFALLAFFIFSISQLQAGDSTAQVNSSLGFHNESEVGVVLVDGNSQTATYNLSQQNGYGWDANVFKFNGKLLKAKSRGLETSRYWTLGLRYERELSEMVSLFAAYNIESDIFAGYDPRHNADVGAKYYIFKTDDITWFGEAGYRYTVEHKTAFNSNVINHYGRLYTEVSRQWNKTTSTKYWIEYLPNFTTYAAYKINTELSASAAFNAVFSMKLGYLIRYNNLPSLPGGYKADRFFTAALVAKF